MRSFSISILSSAFFWVQSLIAQPAEDFLFPIRPGQQNYLAGTMGELRSSHFHAGIDIKTSGITGLPVYAAADGHVSRIKVATGGYGNALYMLHPSGKSTVYAHLQKYNDPIQDYVRNAQYKKESFEIELFPQKEQFSFKKGDIIGYSGNSGSSTGPHLHFEIRDINQHVIDPLKYNFEEIKDDLPPVVAKVVLRTMEIDSRINGQFGRLVFDTKLVNGNYVLTQPINVVGKIGIQVYAYDRLNGASNKNGIPCIEMLLDDQVVFSQNISKVSFSETRSVINHFDYALWQAVGKKYNKLYLDYGTQLNFLRRTPRYGIIDITDTISHDVSIRLTDSYDNTREFAFSLHGSNDYREGGEKISEYLNYESYEVLNNTLELTAPLSEVLSNITLYMDRLAFDISPAYTLDHQAYYLWDLRAGLPDSVNLCGQPISFHFEQVIPAGQELSHYHQDYELSFTERDLYDTLHLKYKYTSDEALEYFHFQNESTPVKSWVKATLSPRRLYDQNRSAVYTVSRKGNLSFVGGQWKNNAITFNTRNFSKYTVATDSIPPSIKLRSADSDQLEFYIQDGMSGINSYRGEIDGNWVLMKYDYKRKVLRSEKKSQNIPFEGEFILRVSDNAGNETLYKTII